MTQDPYKVDGVFMRTWWRSLLVGALVTLPLVTAIAYAVRTHSTRSALGVKLIIVYVFSLLISAIATAALRAGFPYYIWHSRGESGTPYATAEPGEHPLIGGFALGVCAIEVLFFIGGWVWVQLH